MMQRTTRFNLVYALIALVGVFVLHDLWVNYQTVTPLAYSEFQKLVSVDDHQEPRESGPETGVPRKVAQRRALPAPVEKHFEEAVHDVKLLDRQRPTNSRSKSKTGGKKRPRKKNL